MDPIEFEFGSAKNIPIANEVEYMELFIQATEKFYKNFTWYICRKLYPENFQNNKETYGFNSCKAPPRLKELKDFEKDLALFVRKIKFRKRSNNFMSVLNMEKKKISRQDKLIIPADKTTNRFLLKLEDYNKLIEKEIQKDYKKETLENVDIVATEHSKVASELDIADRMFKTVPREAFITLKDHKEDFDVNPKVRLLQPTKPDIGKVAMKILDRVVKNVREKTHTPKASHIHKGCSHVVQLP